MKRKGQKGSKKIVEDTDSSDDEPLIKHQQKSAIKNKAIPSKEDSSSSDSDIENYLIHPDKLNLNSTFFQPVIPKVDSFAEIEKNILCGVKTITNSGSESDADEVEAPPEPMSFQKLTDYTKQIELAKEMINKYNEKKNREDINLDIQNLLAVGEKNLDNSAELLNEANEAFQNGSFHSSDFESCSESEKDDWEEVADKKEVAKSEPLKDGIEITLKMPDVIKKKKGVDLLAAMKRRLNRIKKENQVLVHKVHLLTWIGHGNYVNSILNKETVLGMALSLLPSQAAYPSGRVDMKYLEQILNWYHKAISIKEKPDPNKMTLDKSLLLQITKRETYNKNNYVYIFICILRALGIQCRLVLSLQVEPLRPPASELCSLSTKDEKSKPTQIKEIEKKVTKPRKSTKETKTQTKDSKTDSFVEETNKSEKEAEVSVKKSEKSKNKKETKVEKSLKDTELHYKKSINKSESEKTKKVPESEKTKKVPESAKSTTRTKKSIKETGRLNEKSKNETEKSKPPADKVKKESKVEKSSKSGEMQRKKPENNTEASKKKIEKSKNLEAELKEKDKNLELKKIAGAKRRLRSNTPAFEAESSPPKNPKLKLKEKHVTVKLSPPKQMEPTRNVNTEKTGINLSNLKDRHTSDNIKPKTANKNQKSEMAKQINAIVNSLEQSDKITKKVLYVKVARCDKSKSIEKPSIASKEEVTDGFVGFTPDKKTSTEPDRNIGFETKIESSPAKKTKIDNSGEEIPFLGFTPEKSNKIEGGSSTKIESKKVNLRKLRSKKKVPQTDGILDSSSDEEAFIDQFDGASDDKNKPSTSKPNLAKLKQPPPDCKNKTHERRLKVKPIEDDSEDDFRTSPAKSPPKKLKTSKPEGNTSRVYNNKVDVRKDVVNLIKSGMREQKYKEKSRKSRIAKDEDSDSDYVDEPIRSKKRDSDYVEKVKVKRRVLPKSQLIDRRVFSSDDEPEKTKKRKGVDIWIEVFLEDEEKWISADVVNAKVHCIKELQAKATQPVSYILSWDNTNRVKDVTNRYCPNWNTVTRKLRADPKWWDESLKPFKGKQTVRDFEEDEDLARQQIEQPLPKSIGEFKNHPLYALQRHLLKFEAIYPPDTPTVGFIRKEAVYPRNCVYVLHSRDMWFKEAKVVKPGEKAYKIVKARPKYDRSTNSMITDKPLDIFGIWQVMDYDPPAAENGIIPRNAYGNVELFKPCMIPKNTVHLLLPGLNKTARKLNIDCAPAVVGFDFHGGWNHPTYDGYIVCKEHEDVLVAAWYQDQEEAEKREQEKYEKRVFGNWRRIIRGVFIRRKLKIKYDFGGESSKISEASSSSKNLDKEAPKPKKKGPRFTITKKNN